MNDGIGGKLPLAREARTATVEMEVSPRVAPVDSFSGASPFLYVTKIRLS